MTRLALIAHEDKTPVMIDLVEQKEATLAELDLVATGTTGQPIRAETDLDVERKESGSVGGDTQIGAEVVEGEIDGLAADD